MRPVTSTGGGGHRVVLGGGGGGPTNAKAALIVDAPASTAPQDRASTGPGRCRRRRSEPGRPCRSGRRDGAAYSAYNAVRERYRKWDFAAAEQKCFSTLE